MVLSKENTDIIEEIKTLELTTAQKRRLRRKKLKAAKAGSLEKENNTQRDLIDLNTHPSKSIANQQDHVLSLSLIQNYKDENSVIKDPNSINKQKPKCDKASILNDLISTCQDIVLNKHQNSISKDPKKQQAQNDVHHLITNQKKLENTDKEPETKNFLLNEKQKSKHNDKYQIPTEEHCVIKNKKNKFDNSLTIANQVVVNLNLDEKQAVSEGPVFDDNQNSKLKDLSKSKTEIPNDQEHVNAQIVNSTASKTESKNSINSKIENQEPKPHTIESIKNISSNLDNQNMGKKHGAAEPQKQQEVLTKIESKKLDTESTDVSAKSREEIKAAREAKKLAKQKGKKKDETVGANIDEKSIPPKTDKQFTLVKENVAKNQIGSIKKTEKPNTAEPIDDVKHKENVPPIDKGKTVDKPKKVPDEKSEGGVKTETSASKIEEACKSKAELRAERRAKQEAQRAAKVAVEQKAAAPEIKDKEPAKAKEEKSPKAKLVEKSKSKTQAVQRVGWFQHLCVEKDKESLNNIPINSNLHPAVVKLGVQLASHVVIGSNARCIALLDAIKKMVRDYSLPARCEVGRALQAQLDAAASFLWSRRAPTAAETNALKHFRRQLTHLPANVDEFDAKKQLQEEIDRYIREQIDMAGEAISLILSKKISPGDNILTYGCSSLIERVLWSAWEAGVRFRATVVGARGQRGGEMLRRLRARGLPATYVDISALSYVMADVQKVLLGAGALLAHGAALGAAGSAQVALVARARNVPVLVACETHKFSERTHLDPLLCHEIGDPDELIDKTDDNSPLKDWRSNPNLTLLNVTYDVTPPGLITAVVTELGILPCTSAPVVLRFKQSEYGI